VHRSHAFLLILLCVVLGTAWVLRDSLLDDPEASSDGLVVPGEATGEDLEEAQDASAAPGLVGSSRLRLRDGPASAVETQGKARQASLGGAPPPTHGGSLGDSRPRRSREQAGSCGHLSLQCAAMQHPKISLKEITQVNFKDCVSLKVADEQAAYVAPNMQSLAQAYVNKKLYPLAIYDGSLMTRDPTPEHKMVGFVMYQVWDEIGFIMRLMVGEAYQGKGYGRAAVEEVIRRLRLTPQVRFIATSVVPENKAASALYESLGFVDSAYPPDDPAGERYLMLATGTEA
jgi:diamine N-acetyltransferase